MKVIFKVYTIHLYQLMKTHNDGHCSKHQSSLTVHNGVQDQAEIPDDYFATQLWVKSVCGEFVLDALLVRLKAFQLPCSNGLKSIGLSLWICISKTTVLVLWLSGHFVGSSIFIVTTVSLVTMLYCCGWETSEKNSVCRKKKPSRKRAFT